MSHSPFEPSTAADPVLPGIPDRLRRSSLLAGGDHTLCVFTTFTGSFKFAATAADPGIAAH